MADIGGLPQLLPTLLIEAWFLSWIWSSQVQLVWLDSVFWQIPDFAFWFMWRTSCLFGIYRMLEIYTEFCILWGAVYIQNPIPSPKSSKFCISSALKHGSCFNFYLFLFLYVCAGGHGGQKSQKKNKIKIKKASDLLEMELQVFMSYHPKQVLETEFQPSCQSSECS